MDRDHEPEARNRSSLDLSTEQRDRLGQLMAEFEDSPRKQLVIQRAIQLLETVARHNAGATAVSDDEGSGLSLSLVELHPPTSTRK